MNKGAYEGSIHVLVAEVSVEIGRAHGNGLPGWLVSLHSSPPFRGQNAEHVAIIESSYDSGDWSTGSKRSAMMMRLGGR